MRISLNIVASMLVCLAMTLLMETIRAEDRIQMALEDLVRVEWQRLEDASRYKFYLGDVKLGRSLGGARFFLNDPDIDWSQVRIEAETFGGDPVGETEVIATEIHQRLVVRWNEDDFDRPFLGTHARTDTNSSRLIQELIEQPHIIPTEVESLQRVLFGEAVNRPDRRLPSAPFNFAEGEIESFGPFYDLSLP